MSDDAAQLRAESVSELPVLTDGWDCYIRLRRGVYAKVGKSGQRQGGVHSGFSPRPRWKPARCCAFVIAEHGLTCPNCGQYDMNYAKTGLRSFCPNQGKGWKIVTEMRRVA